MILVALKMVDPLSNKIKHIIHPELNTFSCSCVYTSNLTATMNQGNPSDQIFITKLTEIILTNLEKEDFGVNELARASGMTSSSLRRKLSLVSEKSINQLIREVRLQKAMEILQHENATASEVAYKVGFGSPAYFNKCFHDFFGYPPGEVKNRKFNGVDENDTKNQLSFDIKQENQSNRNNEPKPKERRRKVIIFSVTGILILIALVIFFNEIFLTEISIFPVSKFKNVEKSIAVLPFKNLSTEEENQYFADGVMEDILKLIYQIGEFRVVSRTSVEQFRGSNKTINEIARKLDVNFILEGSVQRYEDKVRVNVQLIDARHDQQILSEKYDREFADIFVIQSDIAKQVANKLETVLSPNEINVIDKISTRNTEAYSLYLMGRFFWNKRTEEGIKKSIDYFTKAAEVDPEYALAYAGLADAYFIQTWWGWINIEEGYSQANRFVSHALKLDQNLSEAHATLGGLLCWDEWEWEKARKELLIAIELNPNYATAHQYYAELLYILGQTEEALEEINFALALDPYSRLMSNLKSRYYYRLGKLEESLNTSKKMIEIYPDNMSGHLRLFYIYRRRGEDLKAIDALKKGLSFYPEDIKYANIVHKVYEQSGMTGVLNMLNEYESEDIEHGIVQMARNYSLLGEKEKALDCLEIAMEERKTSIPNMCNNFYFEILHDEPRFKAMVEELGLTKYYYKRMEQPGNIKTP